MPETATAPVPAARPRFSIAVHSYLWGFFALLALSPLGILIQLDDRDAVPMRWWSAGLTWPVFVAGLFWYAMNRCSGPQVSFQNGLLWITRSMMTGWSTISFIVVPPCLMATFSASIALAVWGDLRRQPEFAQARWARLVVIFYRQRLRR